MCWKISRPRHSLTFISDPCIPTPTPPQKKNTSPGSSMLLAPVHSPPTPTFRLMFCLLSAPLTNKWSPTLMSGEWKCKSKSPRCYFVKKNSFFKALQFEVEPRSRQQTRTHTYSRRDRHISVSASPLASLWKKKRGEGLHFKLKATVATRGSTCLLLCSLNVNWNGCICIQPMQHCPPAWEQDAWSRLLRWKRQTLFMVIVCFPPRVRAWFPFNSSEVNSGRLGSSWIH